MPPRHSLEVMGKRLQYGETTARRLVAQCLERVERFDDDLHAWAHFDPDEALAQAEQSDRRYAAGGARGPLDGIPIGIKDIIDVAGWPTRAGSPLREDSPPAETDAPIVAALRRAGAVLLGKTVTVEFACFDPSPARNPWDPDRQRSPGGSSSGSAVAVAAEMCAAAIGTQTGGSLVRPASYCGVATIKPTFGRVDLRGVIPVSEHLDHAGPMARSVGDLRIVLASLPRSADFAPPPRAACLATRPGLKPYEEDTDDPMQTPPRLGFVEEFFMERAEPQIQATVREAIDVLRDRGADVDSAHVPWPMPLDDLLDAHTVVMAADAASYHRKDYPARAEKYGPMIASLLDRGLEMKAIEYAAALADVRNLRRLCTATPFLGLFDALIMPAIDTTAPANCETTGQKTFQAPWSCTGLPVVSLPCGLAADGMPVAIQLVGCYHGDAHLLRVAHWCEEALDLGAGFSPPLID